MALPIAVQENPVRVGLNGLGVTVNAVLVALVAVGIVDFDGDQILKLCIAIQLTVAAVGEFIRPFVTPNGKVIRAVESMRQLPGHRPGDH